MPIIMQPEIPPLIKDPSSMEQQPLVMIEDHPAMLIWEGKMKMIPRREQVLQMGLVQANVLVLDRCLLTMRSKLEQPPHYYVLKRDKNTVVLLVKMRNIACGQESHKQLIYRMVQLVMNLYMFFQQKDETNKKYKENFEEMWDAISQQGGSFVNHPGLIAARVQIIANEY